LTSERRIGGILLAAALSTTAARADTTAVTARYDVYSHGLHVVNATASYALQPWGYAITTTLHAGGFMSWFVRMDVTSTAKGNFTPDGIQPISFESSGFSRGKNRHVLLDFQNGTPVPTTVTPAEPDRETVPSSDLPHAIDTLSAMALLLSTIDKTGQCNGGTRVFDGLRLTAMNVHGPVQGNVPTGDDEFYKGPALRCDFVGQQEAGFIKGSSHLEELKKPRPGSAWFQQVPGFGYVAVRIEFDHPKLGHLVVTLKNPPKHTL